GGDKVDKLFDVALSMVVDDREHVAYVGGSGQLRYAVRTIPPILSEASAQAGDGAFHFLFAFRETCKHSGAPRSVFFRLLQQGAESPRGFFNNLFINVLLGYLALCPEPPTPTPPATVAPL